MILPMKGIKFLRDRNMTVTTHAARREYERTLEAEVVARGSSQIHLINGPPESARSGGLTSFLVG